MVLGTVLQCGTCGDDVPSTLLAEVLSLGPLVTAGSWEEQPEGTLSHSYRSRVMGDPGLSDCKSDAWIQPGLIFSDARVQYPACYGTGGTVWH